MGVQSQSSHFVAQRQCVGSVVSLSQHAVLSPKAMPESSSLTVTTCDAQRPCRSSVVSLSPHVTIALCTVLLISCAAGAVMEISTESGKLTGVLYKATCKETIHSCFLIMIS